MKKHTIVWPPVLIEIAAVVGNARDEANRERNRAQRYERLWSAKTNVDGVLSELIAMEFFNQRKLHYTSNGLFDTKGPRPECDFVVEKIRVNIKSAFNGMMRINRTGHLKRCAE